MQKSWEQKKLCVSSLAFITATESHYDKSCFCCAANVQELPQGLLLFLKTHGEIAYGNAAFMIELI